MFTQTVAEIDRWEPNNGVSVVIDVRAVTRRGCPSADAAGSWLGSVIQLVTSLEKV